MQQQRAQATKEASMGEKDDAREVVKSMLLKTMQHVLGRRKRRPNFRGCFFEGSERIDPSSTNPTPAGTAGERTALKVAQGGGGTQVNYMYRVDPFYQHPVWDSGAAGPWHRELLDNVVDMRWTGPWCQSCGTEGDQKEQDDLRNFSSIRMGAAWMHEMAFVIIINVRMARRR